MIGAFLKFLENLCYLELLSSEEGLGCDSLLTMSPSIIVKVIRALHDFSKEAVEYYYLISIDDSRRRCLNC